MWVLLREQAVGERLQVLVEVVGVPKRRVGAKGR